MKAKFPKFRGIYPGIHHKKLKTYFTNFKTRESANRLNDICKNRKVFFICFTNRCGSNLVCQAIASSGSIRQPGENLNYNTIINHSNLRGFKDYAEYLCWLIEQESEPKGTIGIKSSVDQLIQLFNYGLLEKMGNIKLIMVSRKNTLKQAISWAVAEQTQQWTSSQSTEIDPEAVNLDCDNILKLAGSINQQNAMFKLAFELIGKTPLEIKYEDFVKSPEKHMIAISEHIETTSIEYKSEKLAYRKQATNKNEEFYNILKNKYSI